MHLLRNAPAAITTTWDAAPGAVTVAVVLPDGTTLDPAPEVTTVAAVSSASIPAGSLGTLGPVTVTWSSANYGARVEAYEVVGALLFTVAQARATDNAALANTTRFPDSSIAAARTRITEGFEEECGVSFVPRYKQVIVSHAGRGALLLPDRRITALRSVATRDETTWTAMTEGELAGLIIEPYGGVSYASGAAWLSGNQHIRVGYEYGYATPPYEISRAGLQLLRYQMIETDVPSRATSLSGADGTFSLAVAGRGRSIYGLPDVDAVLHRYSEKVPGVA